MNHQLMKENRELKEEKGLNMRCGSCSKYRQECTNIRQKFTIRQKEYDILNKKYKNIVFKVDKLENENCELEQQVKSYERYYHDYQELDIKYKQLKKKLHKKKTSKSISDKIQKIDIENKELKKKNMENTRLVRQLNHDYNNDMVEVNNKSIYRTIKELSPIAAKRQYVSAPKFELSVNEYGKQKSFPNI